MPFLDMKVSTENDGSSTHNLSQQPRMSVIENFSVAANAFQVVGFADTVFRVGRALYELFDKGRSASSNVALLLLELQALLSVVASVRVFITEYSASTFAQDDGQTLSSVHTVLTLIEQDFRHLRGAFGASRRLWAWRVVIDDSIPCA
jgi:hypothetical protein